MSPSTRFIFDSIIPAVFSSFAARQSPSSKSAPMIGDLSHIVTVQSRLASTKESEPSPAVPSKIVGLNPGLIPTARAIACLVVRFCANLKPFFP